MIDNYIVLCVAVIIVVVLVVVLGCSKSGFSDKISLDELSIKYKLDKSSLHHNYAPFYDNLLEELRDTKVNMIEIGIGTLDESVNANMNSLENTGYKPGNSLRCWKEYFYNANLILGFDISPDCMFSEHKIRTELADSNDSKKVSNIMNTKYIGLKFDVILDDGLHTAKSQFNTLMNFFPYLKEGGFYIIEDINTGEEVKNLTKIIQEALPRKIITQNTDNYAASNSNYIVIFN